MKRSRILLVGAAALLGAAPAHAATTVVGEYHDGCNGSAECEKYSGGQPYVVVKAMGSSRADRISVTRAGGSATYPIVISDAGGVTIAPPYAGMYCQTVDAATARCTVTPQVIGGAGDDGLDLSGLGPGTVGSVVDGQAGNDTLTGSPGFDALTGGPGEDSITGGDGNDRIDSGPGRDHVSGGSGDDEFEAGPGAIGDQPDPDVYDGGPGRDLLSYGSRSAPVNVDLRRAGGQGQLGEGDSVAGVEDTVGGIGPDTLTGDDGPNLLAGGTGPDVLSGLGGDDQLADASFFLGSISSYVTASSKLDGGAGNDRLSGGLSAVCGAGTDSAGALRAASVVDRSCESVLVGGTVLSLPPLKSLGGRLVTARLTKCGRRKGCRWTLGLRRAGRDGRYGKGRTGLVGISSRRLAKGRAGSIAARLGKSGRLRLKRAHELLLRVELTGPARGVSAFTIRAAAPSR